MLNLHPDKLIGVARAVQSRPRRPVVSAEEAAIRRSSKPKALTPQKKKADGGLMEQLAYRLRDAHWADHMDRLARRVDTAVSQSKPVGGANKNKVPAAIKPIPMAPAQGTPILMLSIGATPPKQNA